MKIFCMLLASGLLLFSPVSNAQEMKIQLYTGISADFILLAGSFDGNSFFTTEDETILVPKLKPNLGFGILFGFKMGNGAVDFAYHVSRMEYTSMEDGFSGKSTTHIIRYLSFKKYFSSFADRTLKPYIDIDLSVAFSHFEKISYLLYNPDEFRSANYGGVIFGAGFGSQIELTERLAIDIKVLPEYYMGTDIRSKDSDRYEITKFNNFLLITSVGINYYF